MNKRLIILELANNHMGDVNHAKKIVKNYYNITKKYKNFEFVLKFQMRNINTFIDKNFKDSNDSQILRFKKTFLSKKEWSSIINYSVKFFRLACTGFDESSVTNIFENKKFSILKIASCSATDWPLLEHIHRCYKKNKKKIICSLGGLDENEIISVISFFKNRKIDVKFLYCVGLYPTNKESLNLIYFEELKSKFGDIISGFSTHEEPGETLTGSVAIGSGVKIFEKHIGLQDVNKKYKINSYSTNLHQFNNWLKNTNEALVIMGDSNNRNKNIILEKEKIKTFQRGVYCKKKLHKDDQIRKENVYFAFPCQVGQLSANEFSKHQTFYIKSNIEDSSAILKKNIFIQDSYRPIKKIRDKVKKFLLNKNVILPQNARLEISHHYGIKNFYRFGTTMITIINNEYCKKIIIMLPGQKHPAQYHKVKEETFFILNGSLILKMNEKKFSLNVGDLKTIRTNVVHEFFTKTGAIIEELSTKSVAEDSFYLDKKILRNKNRKSFISL